MDFKPWRPRKRIFQSMKSFCYLKGAEVCFQLNPGVARTNQTSEMEHFAKIPAESH